jgi:uridine kinase
MEELQQYFREEYAEDKKRLEKIDELVLKVVDSIIAFDTTIGIPYEIDENGLVIPPKANLSVSTNSMILYVLLKINGEIKNSSPLIPNITWNCKTILKSKKSKFQGNLNEVLKLLLNRIRENIRTEEPFVTNSSSFGKNDPFTLSWLIEILSTESGQSGSDIKNKIIEISIGRLKDALSKPDKPILEFIDDRFRSTPHIFPLIHSIHIYNSLVNLELLGSTKTVFLNYLKNVQDNLLTRIFQQLNYSAVAPNLFDTSELVMSLEGILLLEDDAQRISNDLIKKIFEVIKKHQDSNLYWRPLKPFVITSQGLTLIPLSIEIANCLMRICKHLQSKKRFYFYNYFEMFRKYFDWLDAELIKLRTKTNGVIFQGWHSEHVSQLDAIHPWETAQVVIFLMNYKRLLEDNLAFKSLTKAFLAEKNFLTDKDNLSDFLFTEPLTSPRMGNYQVYRKINEDYIVPQCKIKKQTFDKNKDSINYSMLLYGPPGTGKSTVAETIARELNWKMITVTPSDFLQTGGTDVEYNAKNIFKVLEEQQEAVILLDEIDQLLLDRDSTDYSWQDDVFKFMTPSMLVKLKDLRSKEKTIFIIATNYEEHIDQAIKRFGRIDQKYLVSLPDEEQRFRILDKIINKEKRLLDKKKIKEILKQTVFYSYGELKNLCETRKIKENNLLYDLNSRLKKDNLPSATVKLTSYTQRFEIKKFPQFPTEEFFILVHLKLETHGENGFSPEETRAIGEIISILNIQKNQLKKSATQEVIKMLKAKTNVDNENLIRDLYPVIKKNSKITNAKPKISRSKK